MLFNSLTFAVFFAVVFVVYWRLQHRAQNWLLLVASLIFYGAWNLHFLGLIVGSTVIDWLAALGMERSKTERGRKACLIVSLTSNLGILCLFKYLGFFLESLVGLGHTLGVNLDIPIIQLALPVGISFYTFQGLSYTIDVYRREQAACRSLSDFLLYISFFPQLVAGPIERSQRLVPQVLNPRHRLTSARTLEGIKLVVIGLVQKVAIADTLAPTVDRLYSNPNAADSFALWMGVYAFAVQIYGDFAGYSNIARGTARLLGFDLMVNFRQPHLAASVTEFWHRWHISLSTWLRDYLYVPLGGNRKGPVRTYANLMTIMLVSGLWHGASWNFVIWGLLHGVAVSTERLLGYRPGGTRDPRSRWARLLGLVYVFHFVPLALILFRAPSFPVARDYALGLLRGTFAWSPDMAEVLFYATACFALDIVLEHRVRKHVLVLFSRRWVVEACSMAALILFSIFVGENHVIPFVYFQF